MAGSVLTAKKPEPTRARGVGLARLSQWTTNFPDPVTVAVRRTDYQHSLLIWPSGRGIQLIILAFLSFCYFVFIFIECLI